MLGGAVGAAVLALSGCEVRLEDDAPPIPLIPAREPIPAEPDLLWLLADCQDLAEVDGPYTDLYVEQVAVLRSALFRAGIPIDTLDELLAPPAPGATEASPASGADSPRPEPTLTTSTATATATRGPQTGPEAALRRIDELSRCGPGIFPVIASLLAQRWAAVTLGGGVLPPSVRRTDPAYRWQFPHLAVGFVEVTHPAVYGFEIVAAQTGETRDDAIATLTSLRGLRREQNARAGGTAPDPAFGYPLPFPVDSEESALRLATHVLAGLTDGYGGLLTTVTGSAQEDTAMDVVGWLGAAAALAAGWGAPLEAFPGTQVSS